MAKSSNISMAAPAIAITVIVLGAVAAERWLIAKPSPPPKPRAPVVSLERETDVLKETAEIPAPAAARPVVDNPPVTPVKSGWPTYHGEPDFVGYTNLNIADNPSVLWQYLAEGRIEQSPVADELGIYVTTTTGLVLALDFQGNPLWQKQLMRTSRDNKEVKERTNAPIACFRSTVFVGSEMGNLYALDAKTGEIRWTYDIDGEILGTVNFSDSVSGPMRLYAIERGGGALHCLDFDAGHPLWVAEPVSQFDGSAAVLNDSIVFGSCASAIHVYAAANGELVKNIEMCGDCQVASGPALVGDDIYSGNRSGQFVRASISSGQILWTNQDAVGEIFTTPAVSQDIVIYGSEDGNVYALHRDTGQPKWRFSTNGIPMSAVIANDKVIVCVDGVLHLLALDNGNSLWNYEVSDRISSPAIVNDMIIVGSEDGTVIAFGNKA